MRTKYKLVSSSKDETDIELGILTGHDHHMSHGASSGMLSLLGGGSRVDLQNERILRLLHAILGGMSYGLAMLLMLVAMTYNPSLFLALVIGYTVGDFIFFRLSGSSPDSGCH